VRTVRLSVNGQEHELRVSPGRLLLDCLRYDLGLTGTKEGCGVGVCGACTVLVDGKMISSCLTLAAMADGQEIVTIEGLAHDGDLDALQQAFIERGGFQCGICTPGQILAARALLDQTPRPSEEQVKEWMTGNLCRCTGYYKIIEAVLAAVRGQASGLTDTAAGSAGEPD
jgi:carbon-monoxide dehydrogenase small subunit